MSIFSKIKSAIFGSASAAEPASTTSAGASPANPTAASRAAAPGASTRAASGSAPMSQVDVEAVLTGLAAQKKQKLEWRTSIADLMKLLDLDSSITARKELAHELNYSGDTSDSASMNIWLHKQVMNKLAASGGKVPDDLRT
jgi:hypothetical protein